MQLNMFGEKRGGATSWTPSTLTLQSLPQTLESSTSLGCGWRKSCHDIRHPCEVSTEIQQRSTTDSSLTSLGWLPNLKVLDMFSPEVRGKFHPPSPCSEDGCSWETVSSTSTSPGSKNDPFLSSVEPPAPPPPYPISPLHQCIVHAAQFKLAPKQYRNDSTKPPYSHATLIYLAIQQSRSGKLSFHDICRWIKTNFKFFKETKHGWQNSLRQNLEMDDMFVKISRTNGESSKGCYWTIHPKCREFLHRDDHMIDSNGTAGGGCSGKKLKRAYSYGGSNGQQSRGSRGTRKRVKSEAQIPVDPCGLPGDLDWISLLSSQRVSCGSCPSQACRPVYGSPILGPVDLGHVGDPMTCSPLVVPASISSSSTSLPIISDNTVEEHIKVKDLEEEVFNNHNSPLPSPHLLPWADSRPESPCRHPWAEARETTLTSLGHQQQHTSLHHHHHTPNNIWSPETNYTASSCLKTNSLQHSKTRTARSIY